VAEERLSSLKSISGKTMKIRVKNLLVALALLAFSTLNSQFSTVFAQGTAFTYEGRLFSSTNPASGTYNLTFTLFNTNTSGVPVAGPVTNNAVFVTNGLFTVLIDFGPGVFTGQTNWLQIGVETNLASPFTTLTPRQQLTPVPYAIYAENAPASQLTSIGNNNGGSGNFFVGPSGNSTTSGSANTANGVQALELNGSGTGNTANGYYALYSNTSGFGNTANGDVALYSNTSGNYNTANGIQALEFNVSGTGNTANGAQALFVNMGSYNTANGYKALFYNSGGSNNIALGYQAGYNYTGNESGNIDIGNLGVTGEANIIRIGSGQSQTFIAGVIHGDGGGLTDLNASQLASIGNNNGGSGNFFVGPSGNSTNSGSYNTANGYGAFVNNASGSYNTANGLEALFANSSGSYNTANGLQALLLNENGSFNTADGASALWKNENGSNNIALGYQSGENITGSSNIDIGNPGFAGDNNTIRIGDPNVQTSTYIAGVINGNGGGLTNLNASQLTSIGNTILANSTDATISGGNGNTIDSGSEYSTIAGGSTNTIWYNAFDSVIGGGQYNEINDSSDHSTIAGGWDNGIDSFNSSSTIGGGYDNGIGGGEYGDQPIAATIPGGANNYAGGNYSFAAGNYARANDDGSFVWSDGTTTVSSFGANTFTAHASGGFQFQLASSTVAISASGTLSVPVLTITGGSDVAEPFAMSSAAIPKGSVVIIDEEHPGQLKISDQPYDTRVAGIVSGANGVNPGISLHQVNVLNGDLNVALSGRVYVLADTGNGSIHPGDLLTTSATPGHAMKVTDHARAQGAILGKAMTSLSEGKGMVLVLVTLQ
jgi:hypothetical protein